MADAEDYTALKTRIATLQREADRARGELDATMKRIADEYGCSSIKEAKAMMVKLTKEQQEAKQKFDEAYAQFEREHGDVINDQKDAAVPSV